MNNSKSAAVRFLQNFLGRCKDAAQSIVQAFKVNPSHAVSFIVPAVGGALLGVASFGLAWHSVTEQLKTSDVVLAGLNTLVAGLSTVIAGSSFGATIQSLICIQKIGRGTTDPMGPS